MIGDVLTLMSLWRDVGREGRKGGMARKREGKGLLNWRKAC